METNLNNEAKISESGQTEVNNGGSLGSNGNFTESRKTEVNSGDSFIPKITSAIGRGEDARNSLVYITIKYCFISACVITILVVLNHWIFRKEETIPNFVGDIQIVWDIAVPLITLALGYAFGKLKD